MKKYTLLKFYTTWCQPCKMLSKTINSLFVSNPEIFNDIEIKEINLETETTEHKVTAVPTLILINNTSQVIRQKVGNLSASELIAFLKV